ncbi:biotin--[acetyl-CoA-carboxylase] ligase [bacterium]|nr:biotin--[acetyl-CoA-carboxylase] ligase [bacterium]
MTSPDFLQSELKRLTRFKKLIYRPSCESTQDMAVDYLASHNGDLEDAIFWTDHQTRGRGRQERVWDAAAGLDLTVTLQVTAHLESAIALAAALPVAVVKTCEPIAGQPLRIKWPNDIYAGDRKLSGVLIDRDTRRPNTYRIGVGVNVNRTVFPSELSETATSLRVLSTIEHDPSNVLVALAKQVDAIVTDLCAGDYSEHEQLFGDRLGLLGKQVQVTARETVRGELTAINFEQLVLDHHVELPLAVVRSLASAPN